MNMADNDAPISPRHVLAPASDTVKDGPVSATQQAYEISKTSMQPMVMSQPPSLPVAESDNPDAMALRAAISVLQMQRDKSKRDLKTLEKLKQAATSQPELFAEELAAGRLRQELNHFDPLRATFESDSSDEDENMEESSHSVEQDAKFHKFPSAQNVFRAPHINWSRYNIVGEPLDRMHKEQRLKPGQGDMSRGDVPVQVIAAPYSPFTDKLSEQQPSVERSASNKPA